VTTRGRAIAAVWVLAGVCVLGAGYRATWRDFSVHAFNPRLSVAPRGAILDVRGRSLAEGPVRARRYPLGAAAVHVVGYKRSLSVSDGMEKQADQWLSLPAAWFPPLVERSAHRPRDVRVTLDADWQQAAYRALGSRRGAVVVLDADTGAVVASVSKPGFPPEALGRRFHELREHPAEPFLDRVRSRVPPGSTFKLLFARHLLATGEGDFRYDCPGHILTAGGHRIRCARPHGWVDLAHALAVSCNGYFVRAASEEVGGSPLATFRSVLGTGFPGEVDLGDPVGRALLAIGQGNARVQPIRMAALVATHFGAERGGALFRPTLIVEGPEGADPFDWSLAVAEDGVRERLAELMDGAANQVRRRVRIGGGCRILGAKTGTAETPSDEDFAWLVGAMSVPDAGAGARTLAFAIVVEGIQGFSIQHTPGVLERTVREAVPSCS
jgi:peptidoglycan glycosyltransferase